MKRSLTGTAAARPSSMAAESSRRHPFHPGASKQWHTTRKEWRKDMKRETKDVQSCATHFIRKYIYVEKREKRGDMTR